MSNFSDNSTAYGFSQPLVQVPQKPIVSNRNPTPADKSTLGTLWINPDQGTAFILTRIDGSGASWVSFTGSSSGNVAFLAILESSVVGSLGGSETYAMGVNQALTTISDPNNVFFTGGSSVPATFITPVTGLYSFTFGYGLQSASNTSLTGFVELEIRTTTTSYRFNQSMTSGTQEPDETQNILGGSFTVVAFMNNLDEAEFLITANEGISGSINLLGDDYPTTARTFISGNLVS